MCELKRRPSVEVPLVEHTAREKIGKPNGDPVWVTGVPLEAPINFAPVVDSAGNVFVVLPSTTDIMQLHGFSPTGHGSELPGFPKQYTAVGESPTPSTSPVIGSGGQVYVGLENGKVVVFE